MKAEKLEHPVIRAFQKVDVASLRRGGSSSRGAAHLVQRRGRGHQSCRDEGGG
jgi:hypothetical protein